ncbi:MAG: hypothetical protein WDN50_14725 [Bradyrhizobium sp.]
MKNWLQLYTAVFTNRRLSLIASLLAGWLLMAGISAYYDFTWVSVLTEP